MAGGTEPPARCSKASLCESTGCDRVRWLRPAAGPYGRHERPRAAIPLVTDVSMSGRRRDAVQHRVGRQAHLRRGRPQAREPRHARPRPPHAPLCAAMRGTRTSARGRRNPRESSPPTSPAATAASPSPARTASCLRACVLPGRSDPEASQIGGFRFKSRTPMKRLNSVSVLALQPAGSILTGHY